jgi:hypothetical protein
MVLKVDAPTRDRTDVGKDSLYEEYERVFDKFPNKYRDILLGDSNAKAA